MNLSSNRILLSHKCIHILTRSFYFKMIVKSSETRKKFETLYSMGLCNSKPNVLAHLDDSVKVMVRHDAKALERKGQKAGGFVPRAAHPIVDAEKNEAKPVEAQEE
jgi:hypothetical protein